MNMNQSVEKGVKRVLYSRDADGSYPVHILRSGFKLIRPADAGGVQTYATKRQLLIAITGHPKARNWTFDRYFKQGKHDGGASLYMGAPAITTLEWFVPTEAPVQGRPVTGSIPGTKVRGDARISISEATAATLAMRAGSNLADEDIELGIDLVNRSHEVAKLLFKGFGSWIRTSGYDPEEVLQEVYVGLLVRNKMTCPWDARKSSFGHYVHMVCNSIMSNYHRKRKRIRECEQTGTYSFDENGDWTLQDVASSNLPAPPTGDVQRVGILEATDDLLAYMPDESSTYLARKVLPLLRDGYTRTDIARLLGVNRTLVMAAVVELQTWAVQWFEGN
tara:strand:+ start:829 stop:1830 length:1002 start_codon:yes stop_codon:yes gene_type:complete